MTATSDVILIGGGVAGSVAATLLARQGLRVTLIDRWQTYPECFKAEKIEADQADLYRKFDMLETLLPHTGAIREVWRAQDGRIIRHVHTEQYGIFYHDMVNALRGIIPSNVNFIVGRVQDVQTSDDLQTVTLASGQTLTTRLVVLASGTGAEFAARLGLQKRMIQKEQSFAAGFNIEVESGTGFDFDSITYYPTGSGSRVVFLTLFRIKQLMRANLFCAWSNTEPQVREFLQQPEAVLARLFPRLTELSGRFHVSSKVESGRIDLYRMDVPARPGILLLADAFQSVCPVTGTGLSKVLTDCDVLAQCLPQWLATPGMSAARLGSYYGNRRKLEVDKHSLEGAAYGRRIATDNSLGWRLRRAQWHWENRLSEALHTLRITA
jgi:2-polyprenyl-6-methoxyphenol hydroxylase-like FAD-dependent oxidoreductase